MAGLSDLAELYEAVFGTPPSHTSQIVLRRMEQFLKLKRGDAFSRMLIVQLRCADQIEETRRQLQATTDGLAPLLTTARTLTRELEHSTGDIARRNRRIPAMARAAELVEVGSRPFPLFAYLACALQSRQPHDELHIGERRTAARFDLFFAVSALLAAMAAGALLERFGLGAYW